MAALVAMVATMLAASAAFAAAPHFIGASATDPDASRARRAVVMSGSSSDLC
jgi:hypothetical protein